MANASEGTRHGFTREQLEFLREEFGRKAAEGFDRPTQMWLIGGLVAIGLAVAGMIWAQIGANRVEIRENRAAIAELAKGQAELAKGQARIEAILEERLPRGP